MQTITWVTFAGSGARPMGMQHYELEILAALEAADRASADETGWCFSKLTVGALRPPRVGTVRIPTRLVATDRTVVARFTGRLIYRHEERLHRFDLRLPPSSLPEVVTVHDLPPLRFDDEGELPAWAIRSARRARMVICPSQFAADEVASLTGATRIAVVPNGVGREFVAPAHGQLRMPSLIDGPYALHVGGATQRKNLTNLAEAWKAVRSELPDLKLVLVGPPDRRRNEAFAGIDVTRLGYRSHAEIAALMTGATMVVVPSVYEGFGLPALEAMAVGTPVVATRRGALPEVCGTAALLVEPDPDGLAEGIVRVASDGALRSSLRGLGAARVREYTWASSARGHLMAYNEAFST